MVVVALFFPDGVPSAAGFAAELARSPEAWLFVLAYGAAGGGLALLVFATSAVSLPMLLDRANMDIVSAMIVSFNVVRLDFAPMMLWAATIVALTALGFATWYLGLVVALPFSFWLLRPTLMPSERRPRRRFLGTGARLIIRDSSMTLCFARNDLYQARLSPPIASRAQSSTRARRGGSSSSASS